MGKEWAVSSVEMRSSVRYSLLVGFALRTLQHGQYRSPLPSSNTMMMVMTQEGYERQKVSKAGMKNLAMMLVEVD